MSNKKSNLDIPKFCVSLIPRHRGIQQYCVVTMSTRRIIACGIKISSTRSLTDSDVLFNCCLSASSPGSIIIFVSFLRFGSICVGGDDMHGGNGKSLNRHKRRDQVVCCAADAKLVRRARHCAALGSKGLEV